MFCLNVPGDTREVVTPMTHTNGTAKDAINDHDDRYAAPTAHDQSVGRMGYGRGMRSPLAS